MALRSALLLTEEKKNMSNMQVGVSDPKILEEIKQELKEILDILE